MPYIGKPQSADPITVNTSNIDDGTIQAVDISSSFAGHISGSFGNQRVGTTDDVLFNEVTASGVISGSSVNARTISNDAGDLTIDSAGDVVIDADGADVKLKDDGTEFGRISRVSSDLVIKSISNNNDILFKGVDDSATITALTLDMSEAGDATFNRSISASSISTGSIGRLQTHQANALFGSNTLTLGGDLTTAGTFTTQNNNVTVNAVGAARTLTLNESLTVGDGNDGTITFSGASKTLTVEENSNVNQDLTTDASPTFAAGTITGDFAVGGTLTAQEVHTEFESASILFTSGSTQFGNSSDDVHDFKGNTISGSATSTGSFGSIVTKGTGVTTFIGGNVGVGTDAPADELEVHGATAAIKIRSTGTDAGNNPSINFQSTEATGLAARAEISADDDGATTKGALIFKTRISDSVTEAMRIDGTGNVGIGTGSPAKALHIVGAADNGLFEGLQIDNTDHASGETGQSVAINMRLAQASTMRDAGRITIGKDDDWDDAAATDSHMTFKTMLSNTLTEHMRITSAGAVGIGTASPGNNLHLHTDNSAEGILLKSTGDTRNNLIFDGNISSAADNIAFIDANWNGTNVARISMFTGTDTSNKDDGRIGFATAAAGTVAERMRIETDGSVGIGSSSPTAKLDVNGGAVINGDTIVGRGGSQKGKLTIQSRTGTASRKTNAIVAVPYNDTSESICMIGMDGQAGNNEMHIGSNTGDFMSPTFIDFFTASDVNSQTNSRAMRITSAGQVGIGTNNLGANLHVRTTGAGSLCKTRIDGDDGTNDGGAVLALAYNTTEKWNILTRNQTSVGSAFSLQIIDDDGNDGVFLNQDATSFSANSDERMKENIVELENAIDKLNTLRCVNFTMKHDSSGEKRIGLIAQDVYKVYPEVTTGSPDVEYSYDSNTTGSSHINAMSLQYTELVAPMIKAIQELSSQVDVLKAQISGSSDFTALKTAVSGSN